jgi:hypothetical protein
MLSIAAMVLVLGDGIQKYSCGEYNKAISAAVLSRYEKPYLSPPEAKEFAGKTCKIHIEANEYGYPIKVDPTDCSPMQIQASNKALVGLLFPVQQAPGCGATSLSITVGK